MARMGSVEIPIELETKGFEAQIEKAEDDLDKLLQEYEAIKKSKPYDKQKEDLLELSSKIEKLKNNIAGLKTQQDKLDYGSPTKQLEQHDKSLSKIISKVGKWALAVFGVRSMYNFVRQAASTIGQYDKQIGADIQYIRYALAFTLKPVIEWLIKAAYTILQYVGAIIYRLTGYNIFQNSGVKQFKSSMGSAEKSSKKIKDNLSATFDEFNALPSQDSSGGSAGGGVGTPSMDLSKLKQIELPKWLNNLIDFIKENKDTILKILETAFALFTINKVASWISPVLSMFTGKGATGGLFGGGSGGLTGVIGKLGIIGASCYAISEINDKVKKDNEQQNKDLKKISENGTKYAKQDAKNFKNLDELQDALNYKKQKGNDLLYKSSSLGAAITHTSETLRDNYKDNIKQQDIYLQEQIKQYRQGKLNKEDQDKLKQILMDQVGYCTDVGDKLDLIGEDSEFVRDMGAEYRDILGEMGVKLGNLPDPFAKMHEGEKKVKEEAGNMIKDIANKFNNTAIKFKIEADAKNAGTTVSEFIRKFAEKLTVPLRAFGMGAMADSIMSKIKNIKLASGGIVNNPGRGVPVGMAIAGESGREGVIPLTDSRAMAELGQEIGKWVNINNMINNYIDSRRLNQLMVKSQNRDDFARNG